MNDLTKYLRGQQVKEQEGLNKSKGKKEEPQRPTVKFAFQIQEQFTKESQKSSSRNGQKCKIQSPG